MSGAAPPPTLTDEENERQEQAHYRDVLRAFKFYRQHSEERIARAQRSYVTRATNSNICHWSNTAE